MTARQNTCHPIRHLLTLDTAAQTSASWFDWFCKQSELPGKTEHLVGLLKQLIGSPKINVDTMYVSFKNNCIVMGQTYDEFRICDIKTEKVLYTIVPCHGDSSPEYAGRAVVWGIDNGYDYDHPPVNGTWDDVVAFFTKVS